MKLRNFDLFSLGWTNYNGFHFHIFEINDSSFIASNFSFKKNAFLYIDLFWFSIKIFDKSDI